MKSTFEGFSRNACMFFAGLEKDNSKLWFEANRKTFESQVKEPFAALLAALPDRHHPFKVFRLNRDTRFSNDKSPYKLMHGAAHSRKGGSIEYLHLDKDGVLLAAGTYVMEPDKLAKFRVALTNDATAKTFKRMSARLAENGLLLNPGGSKPLSSAPRGIAADHHMIEWLRWKGCVSMERIASGDLAVGPKLLKHVEQWWRKAEPLNTWLDDVL